MQGNALTPATSTNSASTQDWLDGAVQIILSLPGGQSETTTPPPMERDLQVASAYAPKIGR